MTYTIENIAAIVKGRLQSTDPHAAGIEQLLIDSRKLTYPANSLFFALDGPRRNGHLFIEDLYRRGGRNFVVHLSIDP